MLPKPPILPRDMQAPSIDWRSGLKDGMWGMFWVQHNLAPSAIETDKAVLKENVARLIRMTTQKNAGQRHIKDCLDWNSLDTTLMMIACSATSLCLSGLLGDMPDTIEGDI